MPPLVMDPELSSQPHSPQHMSTLASIEGVYASPPHQSNRESASPELTHTEHQLVAGMNALQSHDGDSHRAYLPSQWSACLGARTASPEYENYSLHSSPAVSSLQQDTASAQSSPRSWATSPEQYGPMAWEPVSEYPRLDPQLSGYPLNNTSIPTSFPADAVPFVPSQSLSGLESRYQPSRSQTEPYPARYHGSPRDTPSTPESGYPLSPCSTTLGIRLDEDMASPPGDADDSASTRASKKTNMEGHSITAATDSNNKNEEPYAQLIYRAFLSNDRRALTLQEIYQWFRENTDKGKDDSKGWQNSIRHNLSMNLAFTKRERKSSTSREGEGEKETLSPSTSASDAKKSTEWYLEPWAANGVQSTTRYRKGNNSRRSTAGHGGARGYRSYPPHHGSRAGDFGRCGASSGSSRKGANSSSILTGRIRGRPAPLRNSATAASQMQHHYHFSSPSPHHHQPLLHHHLVNDPSSYAFYHPGASAPSHHGHVVDMTATSGSESGGLDYDYPDPQLFPHHQQHHSLTVRASSESAIDEPVTPEPPYGDEAHLMLPDLRGGGQSSHHHHHPGHGVPLPSTYPLQSVVGVYDEVVDRYHHGWAAGGGVTVGVEETGYAQGY